MSVDNVDDRAAPGYGRSSGPLDPPAEPGPAVAPDRASRRLRTYRGRNVDRRSWLRAILAVFGLLFLLLLLVTIVVTRDDDEGGVEEVTADDGGATGTENDVEAAGEPTLRIQPQRARVGAPLELAALGTGCGGRNAMLSIIALGTASDTTGIDRLVVRRRVDVAADGSWSATPLLVGQPVGTYRVTASCDRQAVLDGADPPEGRRDVFVAADVLELTGPAVLYDVDVAPSVAPAGEAVTVRLSGRNQCPPGARVRGTVFPTPGTVGPVRPFEAVVDANGSWLATVTIPAGNAMGSYGVEANCSSGFAFATKSLRFVVPGQEPGVPTVPVGPGSGTRVPAPATPVPGRPTYTG